MGSAAVIHLRDVHVDYVVMRHGMRSIKDFVLSFGAARMLERHHILHGIDLQINAGECFGIIGRNGSGKSTLLRVLAGILEPSRGEVHLHGRVAPMLALGVGLEQELSGLENARLCAALMGCDRAATQLTLDNVRSFSGLSEEDLQMPVKRYSSGMTARLGFSIATANDPDILLIDEVLAVGDAEFQQRCHTRIGELKRNGSTVVLVSHSLGEVQRVCDRAACLEDGRIVKIGHPHEVGLLYHQLLGIPTLP